MLKRIILVLMALTTFASADVKITLLDSGRYTYWDGEYWYYVWLTDKGDEVSYLIKSIYRPEQVGQVMLKEQKTVIGKVESGAKIEK